MPQIAVLSAIVALAAMTVYSVVPAGRSVGLNPTASAAVANLPGR